MESCTKEELCTELGASEKILDQLRDELENWLKLQPHLPQDKGGSKNRLENFILGSKLSLEIAKQKLDMYYTIRGLAPELFANRDPRASNLTALHIATQHVWLPKLTPEKNVVTIYRALTNDSSKVDPWQIIKYILMTTDIQMHERRYSGYIYVFDLSMLSLGHLKTITPTLLQKYQMTTKAYPLRIKGFHFINAPPFVDRLVFMIKSILPRKLAARIYVHAPGNLEAFYKYVPKSILPNDYGGDEPSMDQLSDMWREKVDEWRDWFLEENKISVDERLRPVGSSINIEDLFGTTGSFRKLDID